MSSAEVGYAGWFTVDPGPWKVVASRHGISGFPTARRVQMQIGKCLVPGCGWTTAGQIRSAVENRCEKHADEHIRRLEGTIGAGDPDRLPEFDRIRNDPQKKIMKRDDENPPF